MTNEEMLSLAYDMANYNHFQALEHLQAMLEEKDNKKREGKYKLYQQFYSKYSALQIMIDTMEGDSHEA